MKKMLCLLFALCLLTGCASQQAGASYRQISMSQVVELMAEESDYIILDVRTQGEFDGGHIPDAICLPNESISKETAEKVLKDRGQMILVYCRSGNRSKQAAQKLADLGYTNVIEFGGILDWPGPIEN